MSVVCSLLTLISSQVFPAISSTVLAFAPLSIEYIWALFLNSLALSLHSPTRIGFCYNFFTHYVVKRLTSRFELAPFEMSEHGVIALLLYFSCISWTSILSAKNW